MKWNEKGRGALSAAAAGALALSVAACDQIQSLWKSEGNAKSSAGAPAQVSKPEAPIAVTKSSDQRTVVETPKIDEDSALAAKVKSALGADPALRLLAIDTGVAGGVVTLYGTADTRAHREKAAQVASNVPGVKSVSNQLVIVAGS